MSILLLDWSQKTMKATDWILKLNLQQHPEGGYFKESYRSKDLFVPERFLEPRNYATSIYFLLTQGEVSNFHQIKSDEIWYFHDGDPLTVHCIHENGNYTAHQVGKNIEKGEVLQLVVSKGTIFSSESSGEYSLVGCMVSPGFDFEDFKLFRTSELLHLFPQHENLIKKFSKENY